MEFDLGDELRCFATFVNAAAELSDPEEVVFYLGAPRSEVLRYDYDPLVLPAEGAPAIVRTGPGAYEIWIQPDEAGEWTRRWEGTGVVNTADEQTFFVRWSMIHSA